MPPTSGVVCGWCGSIVSAVIARPSTGRGRIDRRCRDDVGAVGGTEGSGRLLDRFDDVHVARAAAEVAADPLADLAIGRLRVLRQEPGGLHDHSGCAEAALE